MAALRLLATFLVVAGCGDAWQGGPANSIDPERDFSAIVINTTLDPDRLAAFARQPVIAPVQRNQLIEARMAEIDLLYNRYELALSRDIRKGNFATSFVSLLLGAGGAVSSGGTAQSLSAANALVVGGSAAFQKEVLLDQSLQAFVAQMRANRSTVRARILKRMSLAGHEYSLQAALSDLADYERAGTLSSALVGLTESAQAEERVAATNLRRVEDEVLLDRQPVRTTVTAQSLSQYIQSGDEAARAEKFGQARQCLADAQATPKPASVPLLVTDAAQFPEAEREVIACMNARFGAGLSQ